MCKSFQAQEWEEENLDVLYEQPLRRTKLILIEMLLEICYKFKTFDLLFSYSMARKYYKVFIKLLLNWLENGSTYKRFHKVC